MKQTTKKLLKHLESKSYERRIDNLINSSGSVVHHESTVLEAYQKYKRIHELLIICIQKGVYEELPYVRRNKIISAVQYIQQYSNNASSFISSVDNLDDEINVSRLWEKAARNLDLQSEMKKLMEIKQFLATQVEKLETLTNLNKKSQSLFDDLHIKTEEHANHLEKAEEISSEMELLCEKTKVSHTITSEYEQEIEDRKINILAFDHNVNQMRNQMETLLDSSEVNKVDLDNQLNKAKELIKESESALQLTSTVGISGAYGSRLDDIKGDWTKRGWLIGSAILLILTMILGLMLTGLTIGDWSWGATENVAVIIGRIAMTGVGIAATVFCAKRYIYLKNLEEDYEYKVVLAKSILAFTSKLKEIGDGHVEQYLDRVLRDLLQDPSRKKVEEKTMGNNPFADISKR